MGMQKSADMFGSGAGASPAASDGYLRKRSEATRCCWYRQEATAAAIKAELAAAVANEDGTEDLVINDDTREEGRFTRHLVTQIKRNRIWNKHANILK